MNAAFGILVFGIVLYIVVMYLGYLWTIVWDKILKH